MSASAHADVLAGFVVSEVLNRDPLTKSITLLGTFSDDRQGPAIALLTRRPFTAEDAQRTVSGVICREKQFKNDIYSKVRDISRGLMSFPRAPGSCRSSHICMKGC